MIHIEKTLITQRLLKGIAIFFRYSTFTKFFNLLRIEGERILKKRVIFGRPYFINIQPTNICDAGCRYCLKKEKGGNLPIGKMVLSDCKKAIDKLKKYAYLIGFQYSGESLSNHSVFEMIDYAHKSGIGTYLSTNLLDLKSEDCSKLITCGLDLLTISIDGISDQTYGIYRELGNLSTVIMNTRDLVKEKKRLNRLSPYITLQFLVMKHNQHEIEDAKKLARDIGVNNIEFKPVGTLDKAILPDDERLYRRVYMKNLKLKRKPCWWLWGSLIVLWDGKVLPCCHIVKNKTELNIFNDDIFSIVNNPFNQEIRGIGRFDLISNDHPCRNCVIPYGNILQQTL